MTYQDPHRIPRPGSASPGLFTTVTEWAKHRMLSSLLTVGATIIGLEFLTRGVLDFVLDLVLLGLILAAGKLAKKPPR